MTIEELQALRDAQWRRIGIVREQQGDKSVEYADGLKMIAALDREIARSTRGTSGGSMCNLAQPNGYYRGAKTTE